MKVNELKITYIEKSHQELSDVEQRLLKEATQAAQKAYAPYSHFRVGAAVKLANGGNPQRKQSGECRLSVGTLRRAGGCVLCKCQIPTIVHRNIAYNSA